METSGKDRRICRKGKWERLRSEEAIGKANRDGIHESQLLDSSGEKKNGEGARKRFNISVLHLNNSDLSKGDSKTVIGKCMNLEEQNTSI
ncbi:hypothetical protein Bca4012_036783 [Brassica carinata]|uniref:Uncharacterized protein n=1 Tax=Brassica carinata TaxID=52824 RepID=A0A8X7WF85_BRACI|nr:hypothetical protein Bca52824_010493 [Brassica carinata]